jgi:hypothetical protein
METPTTKAGLIELIEQERAGWEALIVDVGEERMTQPGATDHWSFKDVAAHLAAWRNRGVLRLKAAKRGEKAAPPPWAHLPQTDDDINAWIYQEYRDRPLADVLQESRDSLQQLEEAVQALSEEELFDKQRFPWFQGASLADTIMGNSMEHFADHEPTVRAWLKKQTA